jgi:hypothetical protein
MALATNFLPGGGQRIRINDPLQLFARTGQGCEFIDRHCCVSPYKERGKEISIEPVVG